MLADTSEFDRLLENLAAPQPQMQRRTFHISSATLLRPISPQFLRPDALLDAEVRLQNLGRKKSQLVSFQKEIAACTQKYIQMLLVTVRVSQKMAYHTKWQDTHKHIVVDCLHNNTPPTDFRTMDLRLVTLPACLHAKRSCFCCWLGKAFARQPGV